MKIRKVVVNEDSNKDSCSGNSIPVFGGRCILSYKTMHKGKKLSTRHKL